MECAPREDGRPLRRMTLLLAILIVPLFLCMPAAQVRSAKSKPMMDVRSFGAECDGTTDDTTSFQAAANAARTEVSTGGGSQIISYPAGNCVLTGQVILYSGAHLQGGGTILVPVQTGHNLFHAKLR